MSLPLVSVVVPTHNRPEMLAEALASVRAQTFTDYEVIVVSNGESDEVRRASHEVAAAHDCLYFALPEGNLPAARNFGIKHAKGEWIAFLDDDDLWLPNKLERQMTIAEQTRADMISCAPPRKIPDGWLYVKAACHELPWAAPSEIMVRKCAIEQVGGFDPHQRYCEDIDLWRRISWNHTSHHTYEILARIRTGHPSMSRREYEMALYSLRHFVKMHNDTPRHLRSELPSSATFVLYRLYIILNRLHYGLRYRLRLRTRARAFLQRVRGSSVS